MTISNGSDEARADVPPRLADLEDRLRRVTLRMVSWAAASAVLLLVAVASSAGDGRMFTGLMTFVGLTCLGAFVESRRHRRTLDEMMRVVADGRARPAVAGAAVSVADEDRQQEPQVFRDRIRLGVLTIGLAVYLLTGVVLLGGVLVALGRGPGPSVSEYLLVVMPGAFLGIAYVGGRRMRVEADLEGLTLFGFLTTRRLSWSRIAGARHAGDGLVLLLDDDRTVRSGSIGHNPGREDARQLLDLIGQRAAGHRQ